MARDEANAKYQDAQAKRYAELFQAGVISKDQAEQLRATADASAQAVNADNAAIDSASAAIGASTATAENAKVQLGFTTIYSPIDGRTGNLTVKQGNVVTANNMDLMTINQVEPIYVTFSVPESQLAAIKKYMAAGTLSVRARPQDADTGEEERGTLTFVDNAVDMTTGTIKLKGTFPNTDHHLWPGQFVRVTLRLTTQQNAVVVPNEAVQTGQRRSVRLRREAGPHGGIAARRHRRPRGTGYGDRARVSRSAKPWSPRGNCASPRAARSWSGTPAAAAGATAGAAAKAVAVGEGRAGRGKKRLTKGRRGGRREYIGNFHPAADRHQPFNGRHRAVRSHRL